MCLDKDTENEIFIFSNFIFNNCSEEKIFIIIIIIIIIDNKLICKNHITTLYKNGGIIKKAY